jgi:nucleoid DNA-binding protein
VPYGHKIAVGISSDYHANVQLTIHNIKVAAVRLVADEPFTLTLLHTAPTLEAFPIGRMKWRPIAVTKKEIVKQISDRIGLTQLKTKEIVQQTFDAIVDTLIETGRIELRNFGVFEVKMRKARKARNPRTGERVDVEPKKVVTFKPGKEMEERVRLEANLPTPDTRRHTIVLGDDEDDGNVATIGAAKDHPS